jgi:hypothetical protein
MGKTPITLAWRDHADFTRMMIELANQRQLAMRGMSKHAAFRYLKTIVADAEVVIGIWQDASEPSGVGLHVIKGLWHLMTATARASRRACASTPCHASTGNRPSRPSRGSATTPIDPEARLRHLRLKGRPGRSRPLAEGRRGTARAHYRKLNPW